MWSRRSSTSTRRSSRLATRSATVRPKKPEPTTTRSGVLTEEGEKLTAVEGIPLDLTPRERRQQRPPARVGIRWADRASRGPAADLALRHSRMLAAVEGESDEG